MDHAGISGGALTIDWVASGQRPGNPLLRVAVQTLHSHHVYWGIICNKDAARQAISRPLLRWFCSLLRPTCC